MKCVGIVTLLLGWLLSHDARAGQPEITNTMSAVVVEMTAIIAEITIGKLLNPGNDNAENHTNNIWVGFISCAVGEPVRNGIGTPCIPNIEFPQLGAGLQMEGGLDADGCAFKAMNGAGAIQGTGIPIDQAVGQSGVPFTSIINGMSPGGVCDQGGNYRFVGWLQGKYFLGYPSGLSQKKCAYLVNMCSGPFSDSCSCNGYFIP